MNKQTLLSGLVLLLLLAAPAAYAQRIPAGEITPERIDTAASYEVVLDDGTSLIGRIAQVGPDVIVLINSSGRLELRRASIRSIERLDSRAHGDGQVWYPHPTPNRYVIGPSAFQLRRGEWNYHNVLLFQNGVSAGITDWLQAGLGINIAGIAGGTLPIVASLKAGGQLAPNLRLSASVSYFGVPQSGGANSLNTLLPMGHLTVGNPDLNLTLGGGAFVALSGASSGSTATLPVIQLGGFARLARGIGVVVDSYYLFDEFGNGILVAMPGFRGIWRRTTFDIAFLLVGLNSADPRESISITPVALPVLGLSHRFESRGRR